MIGLRFVGPVVLAAACPLLGGCITFFSRTQYVGSDQPRLPVQFESPVAARTFLDCMDGRSRLLGQTYIGVPFVTFFASNQQLAESAFFNEQVRICDTNADGLVTMDEATIYAKTPVKTVAAVTTASSVAKTPTPPIPPVEIAQTPPTE
ncbi:MAG: hypothetical protein ACRDD1_10445 [Planctomycetia bacterium]